MLNINVKQSLNVPGDFSLYLSFAYNETMLNVIRSYPVRFWHRFQKEWEVPISQLSTILKDFSNQDIVVSGEYVDRKKDKVTEIDFDFKTDPFSHQRESFLYGMNHKKWFLGDEQGLGKTKQVIDIAVAMKQKNNYRHCLIICGVNGLKWNWRNEVATHSNESAHILGQKVKKTTGELTIGGNKRKLEDLKNINNIKDYFLITNVESLRSADITKELINLVNYKIIQMIAVDEIHKCKSSQSQQGKALLKLKPEYRIAMTGTPLMNSPLDLFIILKWLGYESHSFYQFKKHYAVMGGYGGYEVIGYKHLDRLEQQLQDLMVRRLKEDVLDLPEKTYIDEYVDMLPKQSVIYKEVKADIKSNIDKIEIAPNPLAEMIRLRQATGYTGILSSEVKCSAKLDRLEEIIEESTKNERQVIVFSNWSAMIDEVYTRLCQNYTLSIITGETPDDIRQASIQQFQSGESKVIIGTTGAMGTGITLHSGTVIIFIDHPWNRAVYDQAVDRAHRIGQKNKVTIYNLMCKDTIDERIWDLLNRKGKMADALVDGTLNKLDKEVVEYLLS